MHIKKRFREMKTSELYIYCISVKGDAGFGGKGASVTHAEIHPKTRCLGGKTGGHTL